MASNIRKKFGNVTGEEEAAADNELDECSKKMKKNKRNKKKKRSTEGRKSAKEKKNKSNQKLEQVAEGYRSGDLHQEKVIVSITLYAVQEE